MITRNLNYFVYITLLISLSDVYGDVKSSLTFVIDNTSSMGNDIRQVRDATNAIFDAVLHSNESQIEDFVLVTFNDPDRRKQTEYLLDSFNNGAFTVRTVTKERKVFKDALADISVYGGGACPEYSLAGIRQGILNSRPRSTIYVFTDASAKDYKEFERVRNLAIKRQSQVVFVLTGNCNKTKNSPDYKVYYDLAEVTDGAVFLLEKDDVNKIMNDIIDTVKSRGTILGTWRFPSGAHNIPVYIDSKMSNLKVTVNGKDVDVTIFGPDGLEADIEQIMYTDQISIVRILNPVPGNYNIEITSSSDTHVLVTARSKVKFLQGFSTFEASSITDTSTTPLPDVKSFITIQLTDGNFTLETLKIIENKGNKLFKEVPLRIVNANDNIYTTDLEEIPKTLFKLAIIGFDPSSNKTIIRYGPLVEPQPSTGTAPEARILDSTTITAEFNKPLEIKCLVKGNPKPDIVWNNKYIMAYNQTTSESVTKLSDGYLSILKIDKVTQTAEYECKAVNPIGSDSKTVLVKTTVTPYLKMLNKSEDVFIDYLHEGELVCEVDAYPPASITWYKDHKVLTKDLAEFSDDNTVIKIKNMTQNNDGNYICEARNKAGRKFVTFKVIISAVEIPVIDKSVTIPPLVMGSNIELSCKIEKGIPKPNITWYYSPGYSQEYTKIDQWNDEEYVTLYNVNKRDAGTYSCEARNEFGYDNHEYELIVEFPPAIRRGNKKYTAKVGQSLYIPCFVEGEPKPQVMWYKDEEPLVESQGIRIFKDHSIRILIGMNAVGVYKCNATNKLGTATKVAEVDVYVPVTIESPNQTKFDLKAGTTLSLPCKASGKPLPRTAWTYTRFNSSEQKALLNQLGPSSIKLRYVQPADEGYYTCIATNTGGSLLLTYEIRVAAPPSIENIYTEKEFNPVEGDLALLIECSASGNPQPSIRWKKDGYYVTEGDDVSIENGTLILKHITKNAEGYYICEAQNSLGSDREIYEVNVLSYAYSGPPTSNVIVREGESTAVKCDVPRKMTDQLRWYKNGVMIHKGELTIRNAKISDGGLYTCRVSNFVKSTSGHTMVTVGFKPNFVKEEETNIDFGDEPTKTLALSCKAHGVPKPEFTWWHNGQLLNTTEDYHYLKMELGSQGQYVCEARNDFGHVSREFRVKRESKECLIDLTMKTSELQPLMVWNQLRWPQNAIKKGWVSMKPNDYVYLLCPNGFKIFPRRQVVAICVGDNIFKVQGYPLDYSRLKCKQKVKHIVEKTGETCLTNNTEMLRVGFNLTAGTVGAYEVCMVYGSNTTAYTKQRMSNSIADDDYSETEWSDGDKFGLNFKDAYDPDKQIRYISSNLRMPFHFYDKCSFGMRQLVSPKDLLPGPMQRTAYSYLNVVPHWSTCNNESNNWIEVEKRVRTLAKSSNSELLVWTGVTQHLTIPDYRGHPQFIHITDKSNNSQPVPVYLWKVVQNPATGSSLVIVQVNIPDLLTSAAMAYVRCTDICNYTDWMRGSTWHDTTRGYTFCCSLAEFQTRFGYSQVFENHPNILSSVS